jgi:hypothetical protein
MALPGENDLSEKALFADNLQCGINSKFLLKTYMCALKSPVKVDVEIFK